jgi:hypothetical protein
MGHLFRTGVVKTMTASVELSVEKETSTMTLSIVRRRAPRGYPARRCGNSCVTRH